MDSNMSEDSGKQQANQIGPNQPVVVGAGSNVGFRDFATAVVVPRTRITLDLPAEAAQALNELMSRTGDSPSDLFRKALGLYKLAEEAKREGKAVGIAETPDSLETEFVGL
jgi:hypothetical protein